MLMGNVTQAFFYISSLFSHFQVELTCSKQGAGENIEMKVHAYGMPLAQGLYDPWYEKAACGVGYVVSIDGTKSHKVCNFLVKNEWNDRNIKK